MFLIIKMPTQLDHYTTFFENKTFPVTVICDEIYFQTNIGSVFRICEAFGVEKIIFVGKNIALTPRKINKTSRNTHLIVPHQVMETKEEVIDFIKKNNFEVIALEITDTSTPIQDLKIEKKPIALLIGSEISGISPSLLKTANKVVHINMFGSNSSMNVVQAASIALYEITRKIS